MSSFDRAAIVLGIGAVLAAVYILLPLPNTLNFIHGGLGGVLVLAITGIIAIIGGVLRRRAVTLVAGALLALAALAQLISLPFGALLGGDASLVAVLGGFGIGLLAVSLSRETGDVRTD